MLVFVGQTCKTWSLVEPTSSCWSVWTPSGGDFVLRVDTAEAVSLPWLGVESPGVQERDQNGSLVGRMGCTVSAWQNVAGDGSREAPFLFPQNKCTRPIAPNVGSLKCNSCDLHGTCRAGKITAAWTPWQCQTHALTVQRVVLFKVHFIFLSCVWVGSLSIAEFHLSPKTVKNSEFVAKMVKQASDNVTGLKKETKRTIAVVLVQDGAVCTQRKHLTNGGWHFRKLRVSESRFQLSPGSVCGISPEYSWTVSLPTYPKCDYWVSLVNTLLLHVHVWNFCQPTSKKSAGKVQLRWDPTSRCRWGLFFLSSGPTKCLPQPRAFWRKPCCAIREHLVLRSVQGAGLFYHVAHTSAHWLRQANSGQAWWNIVTLWVLDPACPDFCISAKSNLQGPWNQRDFPFFESTLEYQSNPPLKVFLWQQHATYEYQGRCPIPQRFDLGGARKRVSTGSLWRGPPPKRSTTAHNITQHTISPPANR